MTVRMALLAGLAASVMTGSARAATLVGLLAANDPAALVDHLAILGRTIDLADAAQVRDAIGPVRGLPTRRSSSSAFAGYTTPQGEIVFNPDLGDTTVLLVTLNECIPVRIILDRLRGPEFEPATTRPIAVAVYTDVPYRDRHGTAFTYFPRRDGCVSNFGLSQHRSPSA